MFGEQLKFHGSLRDVEVEDGVIPEIASRDGLSARYEERRKAFQDVQDRLRKAYERNVKIYNLRKRAVVLEPGSKVYRRNFKLSSAPEFYSAKLGLAWLGPYIVESRSGSSGYMLRDENDRVDGPWSLKDIKLDNG